MTAMPVTPVMLLALAGWRRSRVGRCPFRGGSSNGALGGGLASGLRPFVAAMMTATAVLLGFAASLIAAGWAAWTPDLDHLGLGNISEASTGKLPPGFSRVASPAAAWGYGVEISKGKDTPSGHWEIAGAPAEFAWGYFPVNSDGTDLVVWADDDRRTERVRFAFPRQRREPHHCIADFFRPVASGEVEYAIQNMSEIVPVKGVKLVGPLPEDLQVFTPYSAGIAAKSANPREAADFVRFMRREAADHVWTDAGVEPAGR